MKKVIQLTMAGIVALTFSNTQLFAHDLVLEDDMGEGVTLSEKDTSTVHYTYDSADSRDRESMTEAVFFPEVDLATRHFAGDPSTPSAANLMAEGICLINFSPLMVTR